MKLLFLAFVCLFFHLNLKAQQDAQFTQYIFNPLYFNPAFAGLSKGNTLTAIHRSQWFGYKGTINDGGAPNTQMVSYNTSAGFWNGGLGFHIVNDNLGPSSNLELQVSGAYFMPLPNDALLSIGVKVGLFSAGINFDKIVVVNPNDKAAGLSGRESQIRPDVGLGIVYSKGNFFGGISANHLTQPTFDFGQDKIANRLLRHYYLTAGYDYALTPQITITPTLLFRSADLKNYNWDLSALVRYREQFWGGISYRQSESASVMAGYKILKDRSLALAYAIDLVLTDRNSKEPTSQEIMLIYTFKTKNKRKKIGRNIIRTPRYRY